MSTELDIAIIGMSCRLPGARDVDEFWRNLEGGIESITRLSDQEILDSGVSASHLRNPNYVKAAPVLEKPGDFDAEFFGFSPMEARTMDPQHRILLELAHEALEHAGYDPDRYSGRIGVFTGTALNTYFTNVGLNGRLAEEYIPTLIGNDKDFLSTRISYKLNLKGPSITIQTACSTSLVAVHLARQSVLSGESDMALAGAISVRVPHRAGYFCDGGGIVSPDGRVRAFDAKANGTVFGSGGGIVVLKRLADALADGDTIHAVIKGSAVNNDGSEKAGYTAPSVNSQADAVVEALANAGVEADSIGYIEAHGSGTPVGDLIEIRALTKAFRTFTQRSGYCAIGSVKTNVGHLDAAAAVAGMIKTVLALKHRKLLPSLHFAEANPEMDLPSTPFYVNTQLREWASDGPRRAGVMSTGMGGTNAHVVLEEAPEPDVAKHVAAPHLLIFSARTETGLEETTRRLRNFLAGTESVNMSDVAFTLRMGRKAFSHKRYLICADREEALKALSPDGPKRLFSSRMDESRRPVIFLLPGVGDHYVGMARELYETQPVFRQEVERCAQILETHIGFDIRTVLYPPGRSWKKDGKSTGIDLKKMLGRKPDAAEDEDARNLNRTLSAQPALFTIEYAISRLWQSLGIVPDAMVGHSMGEYVAACLAGVLALEDALRLIATRARLVSELPLGAMIAVTLPESELLSLLPDDLSISLINGPSLCVVAGPVESVAEFEKSLNARSVICRRVQNAHAFHSKMLDPIAKEFEAEASKLKLSPPKVPYISNVTGTWITASEATSPAYWARHACRTARFSDALSELWQFKDPVLLEAGPGRTLAVLAMQHPDRAAGGNPMTVSSIRHDYENRSDIEYFWHAVGRLWLSGAAIQWNALGCDGLGRVPLPTYPFERQHFWLEPVRSPDAAPGAQGLIHKNPNPSEWMYVPSWKRLLPGAPGMDEAALLAEKSATWLVFADNSGVGAALVRRLKAARQNVISVRASGGFQRIDPCTFTVQAGNADHYDSLIGALKANRLLPNRIVHAWSITGIDSVIAEKERFARAQASGFYSLLFLAKGLATHNVGHEIDLLVLSNHVHDVYGTETLQPEKSTLLGPCMVIRQEYPNIRVKSVDLALDGNAGEHEMTASLALTECLDRGSGLFVAHRGAQRWVRIFERIALDAPADGSAFRKGGVYLITGGLGRIGIAVSEYLARAYKAKLLLVGRSEPRAPTAIERIQAAGGDVTHISADVADASRMRTAVEEAYRRHGALHGVIHAAGIVADNGLQEIEDCDYNNCERHFRAKALGLQVLEELLDHKPLDFCLIVSSLTSILGGIGHAAYASSNVYMDSFAQRHNRSSRVPWLSVNFDLWRARDRGAAVTGFGRTLEELGHTADEAISSMETALAARNAGQLLVSTGDLTARLDQWINMDDLKAPRGVRAAARQLRPNSGSTQARQNDAPRDETEQRISEIWREVLGVEDVGVNDDFAQLGGHSLFAIKIVHELRRAFQITLPVRVLFDAPTVSALSRHIKERLVAEIAAMSEEEARRLAANE